MANRSRIIVTGGMGFIGSHTAVELSIADYDVILVDDLSNSDISVLEGIKKLCKTEVYFENIDLKNRLACFSIFEKYDNIKGVIHFAAHKAVGESVGNPMKYYDNNINVLLNILYALVNFDIQNLIFSSSCTVYGETKDLPVTEQTEMKETASPYGKTKQMGEAIINDFTVAYPTHNAISLRYFNPIGAHPSAVIGELPLGKPENLMPYITQTAIGLRECLSVFGGDYNTPDGTAIRDYIHVVDLAQAHVVALNRLIHNLNGKSHERFNLGTGKGISVLDVIKSFERTSGVSLNYEITKRRKGDMEAIYADTELSRSVLKWEAKLSLDDMTRTAWQWEQELRKKKE